HDYVISNIMSIFSVLYLLLDTSFDILLFISFSNYQITYFQHKVIRIGITNHCKKSYPIIPFCNAFSLFPLLYVLSNPFLSHYTTHMLHNYVLYFNKVIQFRLLGFIPS
ncbi:hypothetical protein VIGAN_05202700, partial [Vigna angularis var. angularis]